MKPIYYYSHFHLRTFKNIVEVHNELQNSIKLLQEMTNYQSQIVQNSIVDLSNMNEQTTE